MTLDEFIEEICQRPLPTNPMARIRTMAKELAEGASELVWQTSIDLNSLDYKVRASIYFEHRWQIADTYKYFPILAVNGYLTRQSKNPNIYEITEKAFALLSETEPATIFISYKRSESSAFALLVSTKLKQNKQMLFFLLQHN